MTALLAEFTSVFVRGLLEEIKALRERSGSLEVVLIEGRETDRDERRGRFHYSFEARGPLERLSIGDECSVVLSTGEVAVTLGATEGNRLHLTAKSELELGERALSLISAPWFLYQRLAEALESLAPETHAVDRALALFGRGESPEQVGGTDSTLVLDHGELNQSQQRAVQLCSDRSLAFVWGPPGTGKTTTLAHIVSELHAQGKRLLLASTTNAALDQALSKVMTGPQADQLRHDGDVVRLGRTDADTAGVQLDEVVARQHDAMGNQLQRLGERILTAELIADRGGRLVEALALVAMPQQSLFDEPTASVSEIELEGLVPAALRARASRTSPQALLPVLRRRIGRLRTVASLSRKRAARLRQQLRDGAADIVAGARVVLSTLANVYLSPHLANARFDVVIVEEASMATLPTLFYAASLGREKSIIVGDPRQLPPIVTSDSSFAHKVLGRNIFDVTVPEPLASPLVALLDTQYRMSPSIGNLVGELFYGGRLRNGAVTKTRDSIASSSPFHGEALVVVDSGGQTVCQRPERGSSRLNPVAARYCATLAKQADDNGTLSIAVITPYAAQAREIRDRLSALQCSERVECSTIHRFQGQERDVVIIDLVDTAPMRPSRLLSDDNIASPAARLLNVSMSRALGKLIIVADLGYFESAMPQSIATDALRRAREHGCLETMPSAV